MNIKNTLLGLSALSLSGMTMAADLHESEFVDLSFTNNPTGTTLLGIISDGSLKNIALGHWQYEQSVLTGITNTVGYSNPDTLQFLHGAGILNLAALGASIHTSAATKFSLAQDKAMGATSAQVSFDLNFHKDALSLLSTDLFTCTLFGLDASGNATAIDTTGSLSILLLGNNYSHTYTMDIDAARLAAYDTYAIRFDATATIGLSLGSSASNGITVTNLNVLTDADLTAPVPEPATATLGLLGLSTLMLRRRRR